MILRAPCVLSCCALPLLHPCREFGPVFSWQMGPLKMITLLDYDAIRSLLAADNKVNCCCAVGDNRRILSGTEHAHTGSRSLILILLLGSNKAQEQNTSTGPGRQISKRVCVAGLAVPCVCGQVAGHQLG